jgi:hypothetical protein
MYRKATKRLGILMNCNNKFSPIPETYPQGCGKLEMSPVENYIIPVENL